MLWITPLGSSWAAVALLLTSCQVAANPTATVLASHDSPLPAASATVSIDHGPIKIREGTASLVFARPASEQAGWFDFDAGAYVLPGVDAADILAGIAQGTAKFLVITPVGTAAGLFLRTEASLPGNRGLWTVAECLSQEDHYLTGSKPVAHVGDEFCWLTTEGNLVQFQIVEFQLSPGEDAALIQYVVWAKP